MPGMRPSAALPRSSLPLRAADVRHIVLTGFMGSGKTTVGRLLASHLRWSFLDLDEEVTRRTGRTVADMFLEYGEPHFRREESLALQAALARPQLVVALGGGAPETPANRHRLLAHGTVVVHLAGSFEELQARCLAQAAEPGGAVRPVLAQEAAARERFQLRAPLYAEIATLTLDTGGTPAAHLVEAVAAHFGFAEPGDSPEVGAREIASPETP